jgi:hypothetical protein
MDMTKNNILSNYNSLPPEAQQQVIDFIAFLQTRYRPVSKKRARQPSSIEDESFVGIWRDREDMHDSSAWVRNARKTEWGKPA